jgi:hypothetical protein
MKKIAFLFLVLDNPNFPKIWDKYFKNNKDKYNIYIHPKYPDKLNWKRKYMISNLKETEWGFITNAYIELMKEAIKNEDNYKFITISESCIPIQSFDNFYKEAINDPKSWIKIMKISKYDQEERLKIKGNFIKHYARFCLNRDHVKLLLKKNLDFFHNMQVGDEFFLSSLYPLKNYRNFAVTHDDWEWTNKQKIIIKNKIKKAKNQNDIIKFKEEFNNTAKSPKTIVNVEDDLDKIKKCKSFFYRKFDKKSNIKFYWNDIINFHNL